MNRAEPIVLSPEEKKLLDHWARRKGLPSRLVQRARIVQLSAAGVFNHFIARRLGVSRPTVQLWRERFLALRLPGLEKDAPRAGRVPDISYAKIRAIIDTTLHTAPRGAAHWTTRSMAEAQGVGKDTVRRIWKEHDIKPRLVKISRLSRDRDFNGKLYDVVGLYLDPPDKALVLCVDQKNLVQAHAGPKPRPQLKAGCRRTDGCECGCAAGAAGLASRGIRDGKAAGGRRQQEFIRFLKKIDAEMPPELDLHLVADGRGTFGHPRVRAWLRRHLRFHLHLDPAPGSWVNMVERWFRGIAEKRMRSGSFDSLPELVSAMKVCLGRRSQNPQIFVWTASAERVLTEVAKDKEAYGAQG